MTGTFKNPQNEFLKMSKKIPLNYTTLCKKMQKKKQQVFHLSGLNPLLLQGTSKNRQRRVFKDNLFFYVKLTKLTLFCMLQTAQEQFRLFWSRGKPQPKAPDTQQNPEEFRKG